MSNSPTFLVGAERSGTTLFRLLVDSHPEVTCIEGLDYVISAVTADGSYPDLDSYEAYLATETVYSTSGFQIDKQLGTFEAVVDDFLSQRMAAAGKPKVAALLHNGFAQALALWPEARFIHIVRDPRAVALSTVPFEWGGHPYLGIHKWIEEEREWNDVVADLAPNRWLEIRFEDLVTNPDSELKRVCDFLDVEFSSDMYSYAAETDYEKPIAAKADEWRSIISDNEIQMVEARVGELLAQRGYEPSGLASIEVTGNDIKKMKAKVRTMKWRHKLTSHGWVAVAELVTRKIGVKALHTPMKQRMNADERGNRKRSWREPGREYALSPSKLLDKTTKQ